MLLDEPKGRHGHAQNVLRVIGAIICWPPSGAGAPSNCPTAQAFEVGRVGGPTVGERDGVIQVALGGRAVATGRPTGQIPGPHKRRQLHRGPITRLGPGRDRDRLQPGGLGQLGHQLGRDQPVAAQQRCRRLAVALDAGLLGHHMNHHRRHRAPLGGTVGIVAAAGQPIRPGRQRAQRVGAALICAARITGTHRGHQGVQPRIQGLGVGGIQLGVHLAHAVRGIPDRHLPIAGPLPHLAHRIGVGHRHDPIYRGGQLPRVIDGQPRTRSASSASTRANTCGSVIKSVRYTNV